MSVEYARRFRFTSDSTKDNLIAMGNFCIEKEGGNVREWALIEITTFYMNVAALIVSLILERIYANNKEKDDDEDLGISAGAKSYDSVKSN